MKSNFLGKFRAAAARYLYPSQSAAAAAAASPAQSAAVALSPLRSGGDLSSSYKPQSTWGFVVVDIYTAFVIERFGKHAKTLYPGYNFLIPFVDKIAYVQPLNLHNLHLYGQEAITKDDVSVLVDSYMLYQIFDPVLASYSVENARCSFKQLARTIMLTEIRNRNYKDAFLVHRTTSTLNDKIKSAINEGGKEWGVKCEIYTLGVITLSPEAIEAVKSKNVAGDEEKLEFLKERVRMIERLGKFCRKGESYFRKRATPRRVKYC